MTLITKNVLFWPSVNTLTGTIGEIVTMFPNFGSLLKWLHSTWMHTDEIVLI